MPITREKWDMLSENERYYVTIGIEETFWSQSKKAVRHRVLLKELSAALKSELSKGAEEPDWSIETLGLLARLDKEIGE